MTDDPHEILGVSKDASPEEIDRAFKRAAKKAHPDAGGSTKEFVKLTTALAKVKDPENEGNPDNRQSMALERVANFFVNSINATMEQGFGQQLSLDQLDLVQGGRDFFNHQINACNEQIGRTERQIKQFDKALKRLKSKKKGKDALRTMLEHHKGQFGRLIENNKREIVIHKLSISILDDYDFEQEQQSQIFNPYQSGNLPRGFFGT